MSIAYRTIDKQYPASYDIFVKHPLWNLGKNAWLRAERGVSFEDAVAAMEHGGLLNTVDHPNQKKYLNQQMFIVNIGDYAHIVPFVEDDETFFLKTVIPSRGMTKKYIIGRTNDEIL